MRGRAIHDSRRAMQNDGLRQVCKSRRHWHASSQSRMVDVQGSRCAGTSPTCTTTTSTGSTATWTLPSERQASP